MKSLDVEIEANSLKPDQGRRKFIKSSLIGGVSMFCLPLAAETLFPGNGKLKYDLSINVPTRRFDGEFCWCHPRAGIIPGAGKDGLPRVIMTINTLDLDRSDTFKGMYEMMTDDLGVTWHGPRYLDELAPLYEYIEGVRRPVAVSDFWPCWHRSSGAFLGTGHTVVYTPDWRITSPRPRNTSFSVYNTSDNKWSPWQKIEMPDPEKFYNSGAGSTQRYDKRDGTILLPIYFSPPDRNSLVTVIRCSFDGISLQYLEHGSELFIDDETRGLHEPSLTHFNGEYFMTIRNDRLGFVSRSSDGLNFSPMQPWKFDDGSDLGNYNTQQHWVTHSDGLFLVYTRRGANNDHVFRHRAPLFMAQVDPSTLHVIRETEQILVPERGAGLGNFGITDISADETWVTVGETMLPPGRDKYGSDGSVLVARIHWNKPNRLFRA